MLNLRTRQLRRWLAWCLIALLPALALGIAQRQALGPLHVHAVAGGADARAGVTALPKALAWW